MITAILAVIAFTTLGFAVGFCFGEDWNYRKGLEAEREYMALIKTYQQRIYDFDDWARKQELRSEMKRVK